MQFPPLPLHSFTFIKTLYPKYTLKIVVHKKLNLLKWRNLRHSIFFLFLIVSLHNIIIGFSEEEIKNIGDLILKGTFSLILYTAYTWFTVLNYLLGFIPYFKQNKTARFILLDVPFLLSLLYLTYYHLLIPTNTLSESEAWFFLAPIFGYTPYSIIYYFLSIAGYFAIKRFKYL